MRIQYNSFFFHLAFFNLKILAQFFSFQIACIGPLVYTIFHKGCKSVNVPTVPLITAFLTLACACQFEHPLHYEPFDVNPLGLVFMWWRTTTILGGEYSVALYLLLFGLALVNATSNVLFMPFMAQFHRAYLNAYFVGMGLSALIPSLVSLAQGVGNYECKDTMPIYSPPRFPASTFFLVIFVWTVIATIAFEFLSKSDEHNSAPKSRDIAHEETPLSKTRSKIDQANESGEALSPKYTFDTATLLLSRGSLESFNRNGIFSICFVSLQ
ncbi:unnamed protein product [Strongylus vulgaris]|uniref:Riboflavin transporter n=1 Tax=Strongylus vulgaris TaxID=40348 RepID=A0A3P7IC97_STRVU|nr:unnamed protein product [Strongylus vulgaris]